MKQAELIAKARELLQPTPVRLYHVPNWFRLALMKAFPGGNLNGYEAIYHAIRQIGSRDWLDHWGSATDDHGNVAFVSEPYGMDEISLISIAAIARACNCHWTLRANSWWFPGHTIRVMFYQKTGGTP